MKRVLPFTFLVMTVRDLSKQYPDRSTESDFWGWLLDQPVDIVGTALYRFDLGVLFALNESDVTSLDWARLGFAPPIGPQVKWLVAVQQATRAGATWSEAVARADQVLPFAPPAVA